MPIKAKTVLDKSMKALAAGGMVFINGLGAVAGPMATAWVMGAIGPHGYFLFIGLLMFTMAAYAAYRMTQRAAPSVDETDSYTWVAPSASPMAVAFAREYDIEAAEAEAEAAEAKAAEE